MANELRVRANFVKGTLTSSLDGSDTSMDSAELADLPAISSAEHAAISIEEEIVWVTAHTASATTATILRAQEGTSAASHSNGASWVHAPTAKDIAPAFIGCRLRQSGTQNIATSTEVIILFDTEDFDTHGFHSTASNTGRITIPTGMAGKYLFVAALSYSSNATGTRQGWFRKNGTTSQTADLRSASSADQTIMNITEIIDLVATDYIELLAWQTSGSTRTTTIEYTRFSCTYLGP